MQTKQEQIQQYIGEIAKKFKVGDFAITFTYKDSISHYSHNYVPNYYQASKDIHHFLNVVNRKVFGSNYRKHNTKLNNVNTFEHSAYYGIHHHMILENPDYWEISNSEKIAFLTDTWMKMRCSGYYKANNVQLCYNPDGWINYCFKDISSSNSERCDVKNWRF